MARTVTQLKEEYLENSAKKIRLFNPDTQDFNYKWLNEDKTFKAMEMQEFDYNEAQHVTKHLVKYLIDRRNLNPIVEHPELVKEINGDV